MINTNDIHSPPPPTPGMPLKSEETPVNEDESLGTGVSIGMNEDHSAVSTMVRYTCVA